MIFTSFKKRQINNIASKQAFIRYFMILVLFLSRSDVSYSFSSRTNKNPFLLNISNKFNIESSISSLTSLSVSSILVSSNEREKKTNSVDANEIENLIEEFNIRKKSSILASSAGILSYFEKVLLIMSIIHCIVHIKVHVGY